jgi:hypothetical protein
MLISINKSIVDELPEIPDDNVVDGSDQHHGVIDVVLHRYLSLFFR